MTIALQLEQKGIEKGIPLGEQRGIEKGRSEGERQATLKIARTMRQNGIVLNRNSNKGAAGPVCIRKKTACCPTILNATEPR